MNIKMPENYIGVMCGTSLDSLDLSLCNFGKTNKVKHFKSYPIKKSLKDIIAKCKQKPANKKLFTKTDEEVTDFIIKSLDKFTKLSKIKNIKAIGFPGITVLHKPHKKISITLGNPKEIAKRTGFKVIADFRLTDMKAGGQGAPLAPYFHDYISSREKCFINIINLGGFANLTCKSKDKLIAYDTGPANYLIDAIAKKYFKEGFDKNGAHAKKGSVNDAALIAMLSDKYFDLQPPKSTGFEKFNIKWLDKFKKLFKFKNKESLIATVTQLTIISIADAIARSDIDSNDIFFAGGGAKNNFIKKEILKRTGLNEVKKLPWGLDYKNLEASSFAWLAMKRSTGKLISKSFLTGARRSRRLGSIYQ